MRRRTAFTIIELLVSMALIVFIMAILAEAFVEGLKTFRNMKAIGDLNARLRMVQSMLRDDLSKDHFEGKRRLSDPYFWTSGPPKEGFFRVWHGSQLGVQGQPFYIEGGLGGSPDGIPSYYATDHALQYTVKKRGNNRQDFYSAAVPANSPLRSLGTPDSRYQDTNANGTLASYNSQWAEVAWFLRPTGTTAGAQPLFTLYRRQRVVVPSTVLVIVATGQQVDLNYQAPPGVAPWPLPLASKSDYLEVSTSISQQGKLFFNSPRDLTVPQRRFGMNPDFALTSGGVPYHPYSQPVPSPLNANSLSQLWYPILALGPNPPLNYQSPNWRLDDEDGTAALQNNGTSPASMEGQDVILTDVLSFAVIPIFSGVPTADFPPQYQNVNFPPGVSVFDTWSSQADDVYDYTLWDVGSALPTSGTLVPNEGVITGLQISIRVWDAKTTQTRQITIIQDL